VSDPEVSLSPLEAPGARLFERNDDRVLEAFRQGEFDYVEVIGEVSEADFFRAITERNILRKLAETYPSPRKKHEVPLWVYVASDLSMRFHGEHHFYAYPFLIRSGGLLDAFGPEMGHKVIHPQSGDVSLRCAGFNHKNSYDRQTPCDQDYLRKMARQTAAEKLQTWFNRDVVEIFKQHHAFDEEGIFIGDASYLFVPDNPRYEGSSILLFDAYGHPVETKNLTTEEQKQYTWRRCYKLVTLLHTNRAGEFFLFAGVRVTEGRAHEAPVLYELVEAFVGYHGRGVMKRLILDRGFVDGEKIGQCKKEWGIDVLIPARKDMDIYTDVVGLAEGGLLSFQAVPPRVPTRSVAPVHRPEHIRKREEARQRTLARKKAAKEQERGGAAVKAKGERKEVQAAVGEGHSEVAAVADLKTFTTCPVPLHAVVNREVSHEGQVNYWVLLDTAPIREPVRTRQEYRLRVGLEERYRQLKCFSDLARFASRKFSLVVNQVVFVLLVYSLLQWFWQRQNRMDLLPQTLPRALQRLRPTVHVVLIYWQSYVARLSALRYQEILLTLEEPARGKILTKTRQLRRELGHQLDHARSP
jgi:Transposase DDE domain